MYVCSKAIAGAIGSVLEPCNRLSHLLCGSSYRDWFIVILLVPILFSLACKDFPRELTFCDNCENIQVQDDIGDILVHWVSLYI